MSSSIAFGRSAFKRFPELVPLVSIISTAMVGATCFTGYMLATKPDVRVNKRSDVAPWEKVDPEKAQKMYTIHTKYQRNPELDALRKEIGSYRL